MSETRKIAAILVSDVVGYSRLAGADEDRILARLRTLRSDLIDPLISVHHGRIVKRTGDGSIIEFRSVVDAVRLAIEVQNAMVERNADVPEDRRIVFRIGIHLGRRRRGERRRPDGRRRQHRRAAGGRLRAGRRSAFPRTPIARSRAGSISRSPISARPNSRTSPSRSGSIRFESAFPRRQSPQCPPGRPRQKSVRRSCRSPPRSPHCLS